MMSQTLTHLATIRYRDLDPVSAYPLFVFIGGLLIASLLWLLRFQLPLTRQSLALFFSIVVALWANDEMNGSTRWMPGADVELGVIVALAFAFGYGISAFRGPSIIVAYAATLSTSYCLFGCLSRFFFNLHKVASEEGSNAWTDLYYAESFEIYQLLMLTPWLIGAGRFVSKCSRETMQSMRMATGACPACAYDLRGSIGKTNCPECGEAIDWSKVMISEDA